MFFRTLPDEKVLVYAVTLDTLVIGSNLYEAIEKAEKKLIEKHGNAGALGARTLIQRISHLDQNEREKKGIFMD